MEARDVQTAADARQIIEERGLKYVKVGVFDIDGILRGTLHEAWACSLGHVLFLGGFTGRATPIWNGN